MSKFVLSAQKIWYGQYAIDPDLSSVAIAYEAEPKDCTVFGDNTRRSTGGLKATNFSASGFVDVVNSDEGLFSGVGLSGVPISVAMVSGTLGEPAYFLNSVVSQYSQGEAVGELSKFNLAAISRSLLVRGFIGHNATRAATGTTAGIDVGGVTIGQKLFAALHVISGSGTLDVSIGSDNNIGFGTETQGILMFDSKPGPGSDFKNVILASTDDFFRVNYTVSGGDPFKFIVAFGVV